MQWSPVDYANASVLARKVGEEMLSRLQWMTLKPQVVVDLGCGTGEMGARLQEYYPSASIVSLDLAMPMAEYASAKQLSAVCADAACLPLPDQSVDLLFANFLFPWQENREAALKEWRRVLRPDGMLMLSALGPGTFGQWQTIFSGETWPELMDMHDIGDMILQQAFADPVLDINHYTVTYRESATLAAELQASGMLMTLPACFEQDRLPQEDGRYEITYEVVFAHAFAPPHSDTVAAAADGTVQIPLAHLRRRSQKQF